MIITLLTLFALSLAMMAFIPLRHWGRLRVSSSQDSGNISDSSVLRRYVLRSAQNVENWYKTTARDEFLKVLDILLKYFERAAGKIAGQIKQMRVSVQERFRVIPRESMYWKQIHTWRRDNVLKAIEIDSEGRDTSNHDLESF